MEAQISGRHVTISEQFRDHAHGKIEALDKYADQIQRCNITIWKDGEERCVELLIHVRKGPNVVAEAEAESFYKALDLAMDKARRQLDRKKDRVKGHRGHRRLGEAIEAESDRESDAEEPVEEDNT
jgi:ribosomal subunit interface protein